jgi:hypothetical protein
MAQSFFTGNLSQYASAVTATFVSVFVSGATAHSGPGHPHYRGF